MNKVKSYLRTQLTWVQNSLFEGELSESRYMRVIAELSKICDSSYDSITIYKLANNKVLSREDIGIKKGSSDDIIL